MKRISFFLVCITFICSLTGCTSTNVGVENLLTAPRLSADQEEIYKALKDVVKGKIQLIYPRSGDNRSAFVIDNFDSEPGDEALVFYKKIDGSNAVDNTFNISILDKISGEWKDVLDHVETAAEVDKVIISRFNKDNQVNIVVGMAGSDKDLNVMSVYKYENRTLNLIYKDNYSALEVMDTNLDNTNELITICKGTGNDNQKKAVVKLIKYIDNAFIVNSEVELSQSNMSYLNIKKTMVNNNVSAIMIDGLKEDGSIVTQAITFKDGVVNAVMDRKNIDLTSRKMGYYCIDMDKDMKVEIPVTVPYRGYEIVKKESEMMYATQWYSIDEACKMEKKCTSYYNPADSYVFVIPTRWENLVTVKKDTATNEITFYSIDKKVMDESNELMRIIVINHQDLDEYKALGYTSIGSKGQVEYLVKMGNGNKQLVLTQDEFIANLYIL